MGGKRVVVPLVLVLPGASGAFLLRLRPSGACVWVTRLMSRDRTATLGWQVKVPEPFALRGQKLGHELVMTRTARGKMGPL
jgi:hypothetical protein